MSADRNNDLPYRQGVGMLVLSKSGEVFVGQRIDTTMEAWQLPQGGVDEGERLEAAALRELEEELGTNNVEIIDRSEDWLQYDLPEDIRPKVWGGRFRGQQQIWFVMRFLGEDTEINLDTEHPEFSDWKWLSWDELDRVIVPFKRQLYQELKKRYAFLASGQTRRS